MSSSSPEAEWVLRFIRPLNQGKFRYLVSGSVAAIMYGEPRLTNDIDVVVFLKEDDCVRIGEAFSGEDFYLPPPDVIRLEIRRELRGHFNVIHVDSGMKMDCYTAGRDHFHSWAFRTCRDVEFHGERLVIAPPEYVIVRKLEYYREGGSDKHLRDIRSMMLISGELIDRDVLNEWVQRQGVVEQWRELEATL